MRIALAGDHWGVDLKAELGRLLREHGHETIDLGANDKTPSDYPDWARKVGEAINAGRAERGILICGSGVGAAWPRTRSTASAPPCATTSTRPTRGSNTTT